VRHHSPRASRALSAFLEQIDPQVVLVEGPIDATPLIEIITDPETEPPIALLGYRTDGVSGSALWPFAAYSPEYVALAWSRRKKRRAELIDIPVGVSLMERSERREERPRDFSEECARARGFRSFEEFWEASFEAPDYDPSSWRSALLAYAELVRSDAVRDVDRKRDAFMLGRIEDTAKSVAPERIAVVLGAAHAAALLAEDVDPRAADELADPVQTAITVIPYSFPRLSEQLGYGAGNRAPQFYQRAHDRGCSFRRAALEVLVELTEHLRLRGYSASLADTIEAYRLAVALSDHRGKAEPGIDEVRESAIATLCRGESDHVDELLRPSVIGKQVGKVASRIGRNSLQEEFWREVRARKLPEKDSLETFSLRLNNAVEIATSIFLHRLRLADIPYAAYVGVDRMRRRPKSVEADEPGGFSALSRARETWEAQWTPATDVALVERIIMGDSLLDVSARILRQALGEARTTGGAAEVLLESVVTAVPESAAEALAFCDTLASTDDDLPSLAKASGALSFLASFGTSRAERAIAHESIDPLLTKTFDRAVLRIEDAVRVSDDAIDPPKRALITLHEIALSQPKIDAAPYFERARVIAESYAPNPSASGVATGLLYVAHRTTDAEIEIAFAQRLSNLAEPHAAASFLAGFLEVNSLALVRSPAVVSALDAFITGLEPGRFKDALPVLRRALSGLEDTERRYLLENVVAVRGPKDARLAKALLEEKDTEKLKEMSKEVDLAMGDLDDLL
jgi:hypothetical protein